MKLRGLAEQKGFTVVPLSLYFSGSLVKAEIGLCRGKKTYDKRDADAKREAERNIERYSKTRGFLIRIKKPRTALPFGDFLGCVNSE